MVFVDLRKVTIWVKSVPRASAKPGESNAPYGNRIGTQNWSQELKNHQATLGGVIVNFFFHNYENFRWNLGGYVGLRPPSYRTWEGLVLSCRNLDFFIFYKIPTGIHPCIGISTKRPFWEINAIEVSQKFTPALGFRLRDFFEKLMQLMYRRNSFLHWDFD